MTRQCINCKVEKALTSFYKNRKDKLGLSSKCRDCCKLYNRKYYKDNKAEILQSVEQYRLKNKCRINTNSRKYYQENKEYLISYQKQYRRENQSYLRIYKRKYRKENPNVHRESRAKRRGLIRYQKLKNLYKKELSQIYKDCPKEHHVDHIIPLHHSEVCGLHVPWNLQYLTPEENLKKSNKII